jgi:hypothetical protein
MARFPDDFADVLPSIPDSTDEQRAMLHTLIDTLPPKEVALTLQTVLMLIESWRIPPLP